MKKRIFCLILVAVLAASALCVFAACDGNNVTLPDDSGAQVDHEDNQLAFATSRGHGLGIRKVATDPNNAQSVTLVATAEPAGMTDVVLTWDIAWKNASSTWASGKSVESYVTLSASGMQATLNCLQAFGEQIVVTVTSVDNPNATASCTLDYRKRATVSVKFTDNSGNAITLDETYSANGSSLAKLVSGKAYTVAVDVTEGVGTIGSYTVVKSFGGFVDGFLGKIGLTDPNSCMNPNYQFSQINAGSKQTSLTIDRDQISSWLEFDDWAFDNDKDSEITSQAISRIYSYGTNGHLGRWRVVVNDENGDEALNMDFYFAIDVSSIRVSNITLNTDKIEF